MWQRIGWLRLAVVGGVVVGLLLPPGTPAWATHETTHGCPPDSVRVGTTCVDKFEASVWEVPFTQTVLISKIRSGTVALKHLTSPEAVAAGVAQRGASSDDYGRGSLGTGNECTDFYAVSIRGVTPSRRLTWFQALAAARNSFKRLPTNAEWQAAALGTPDPGVSSGARSEDCNTGNGGGPGENAVVATGSRENCKSDVGAFDMVGNLAEWVADWTPQQPSVLGNWPTEFGSDQSHFGFFLADLPGAMIWGGQYNHGSDAGVFAVFYAYPGSVGPGVGFRGAR